MHLNRVINEHDLDMIYISGPGHGGPAVVANTYLEGTYSEVYPAVTRDEAGLKILFRQFSFPGGIPSHVAPETPGSIHEGGELGYSLSHAFGAVFDNPDLIAACVVGDGEAETGPLATAWHSNKFLNPITDGAVLPILHLNGYKIANPTVLARITREELEQLLRGYGWTPYFVEGDDPATMHAAMAATLDRVIEEIRDIQTAARDDGTPARPRWPMIVLATPKGWTGPEDRRRPADRRHVPFASGSAQRSRARTPDTSRTARSVDEELSARGAVRRARRAAAGAGGAGADGRAADGRQPARQRRRCCCATCSCPTSATTRSPSTRRARSTPKTRACSGGFLRDVIARNEATRNFRIFGPDETVSNRLDAVFEATARQWDADDAAGRSSGWRRDGRVLEVLSEHQCQGWLEGYLLTGRHGLFNTYEAFTHIVDSMFNQHAKWLKVTRGAAVAAADRVAQLPAGQPRVAAGSQRLHASGSGLHRSRGATRRRRSSASICRPTRTACLSVMDHCLRSRHYVNIVVAGKHPAPQWLDMDGAVAALRGRHRHLGLGEQRRGRGAGSRDGGGGRRADARDAGRGRRSCGSISRRSRFA